MLLTRGEYTNLSEQANGSESQAAAKDKQEKDNDDPAVASRGDAQALEGATRGEGLDDQPSLAFFPADKTGYTAKVSALWCLSGLTQWCSRSKSCHCSPF